MIFAVGREKNVGKDTFVMHIVEHLRLKYRKLEIIKEGFADRLYDFCHSLYAWAGFQTKQYYQQNPKEKEVPLSGDPHKRTPRLILLQVAERVREFDPEAFMNPVYLQNFGHVKFITDMRTPPEFEYALKHKHVKKIRIIASYSGYKPVSYGKDDIDQLLAKYDDQWDFVIENNGSHKDFREKAVKFCEEHVIPSVQEAIRNGQ